MHKLKYRFVRHLKQQLPKKRPDKRRKSPPKLSVVIYSPARLIRPKLWIYGFILSRVQRQSAGEDQTEKRQIQSPDLPKK